MMAMLPHFIFAITAISATATTAAHSCYYRATSSSILTLKYPALIIFIAHAVHALSAEIKILIYKLKTYYDVYIINFLFYTGCLPHVGIPSNQ